MSRVIVDNQSSLSDVDAVILVRRAMSDGLESFETIQGEENVPKYCHATFEVMGKRYIVYARPRKTKKSAYSFLVYEEEK